MWLPGSVWALVADQLSNEGVRAVALTLPGQGDDNAAARLEDQVSAVVEAVDAARDQVVVVGHSAAASLAWMAADQRAHKVRTVVLIGGFPEPAGARYFDAFPPVDGVVPFPGWEPFEGPDAADLDPQQRVALAAIMVPVPEAVTRETVQLTNPQRYEVPVVMVCPEFNPAEAEEWIDDTELAAAVVDYVDIDSGHWPMVTRPVELAQILASIAGRVAD